MRRTRRSFQRRIAQALVPAVVAVLAALAAGCGGQQFVMAEGGGRFPFESLGDWVSYADHVAVYTVVAEREIPPTAEDAQIGEGLVGRDVTLSIDRVIWSAPGAPPLPPEIHMRALGWVLHDGERLETRFDDGPRVAVGETYVSPLALVEDDPASPEWWPLAVGSQMPLDGDRVTDDASWHSALRGKLAGRSVDQLRSMLEAQRVEPGAARYMHLRPGDRIRAVVRDEEASQGTGGP